MREMPFDLWKWLTKPSERSVNNGEWGDGSAECPTQRRRFADALPTAENGQSPNKTSRLTFAVLRAPMPPCATH
jgi:hypothetical protein